MKKILLLLILTITLTVSSCNSNTTSFEQSAHAYGYFSSIEYMFNASSSSIDSVSILAFDYTNVEIDETELKLLKSLIQELCEKENKTYIEGDMDELIQMEYVDIYELEGGLTWPKSFPDGIFFQMTTVSKKENVIVTDISMWRGSLSANGSTFTAKYTDDSWEVTADGFWIS
ncbi:hypothetical protein RJI07_06090 [Mycoplasmatota bacterium WC30]